MNQGRKTEVETKKAVSRREMQSSLWNTTWDFAISRYILRSTEGIFQWRNEVKARLQWIKEWSKTADLKTASFVLKESKEIRQELKK